MLQSLSAYCCSSNQTWFLLGTTSVLLRKKMENQVCALAQCTVLSTVKGGNSIWLQDMNIFSMQPLSSSLNLWQQLTPPHETADWREGSCLWKATADFGDAATQKRAYQRLFSTCPLCPRGYGGTNPCQSSLTHQSSVFILQKEKQKCPQGNWDEDTGLPQLQFSLTDRSTWNQGWYKRDSCACLGMGWMSVKCRALPGCSALNLVSCSLSGFIWGGGGHWLGMGKIL